MQSATQADSFDRRHSRCTCPLIRLSQDGSTPSPLPSRGSWPRRWTSSSCFVWRPPSCCGSCTWAGWSEWNYWINRWIKRNKWRHMKQNLNWIHKCNTTYNTSPWAKSWVLWPYLKLFEHSHTCTCLSSVKGHCQIHYPLHCGGDRREHVHGGPAEDDGRGSGLQGAGVRLRGGSPVQAVH